MFRGPFSLRGGREQLVAPFQRVVERAVTPLGGAAGMAQQRGVVTEALGDLLHAEHGDAQRRQLDGQRQPVELLADVGHGLPHPGRVHGEAAHALLGAAGEEGHGAVAVDGQSGDPPHLLAGDAQRLAAGDDHAQRRRSGQQVTDQPRGAGHHLLAVVQDEQ